MFDKTEFRVQVTRSEKTYKEIAEYLGIDESTLWRKIQNDGSFTREEINKLINFLGIVNPEAIFFAG
jgi:DNA-binding CsgD family transcriptional regulator